MRFDLTNLLAKLENPGNRPNYDWIRARITNMWPSWVKAGEELQAKLINTDPPPMRRVCRPMLTTHHMYTNISHMLLAKRVKHLCTCGVG